MAKASVLMVVSHYRGFGGHEMVMNNLCSGLVKLGYDVSIGAFTFARDPPENIQKKKLSRFGLAVRQEFDLVHN
ncbi:MAG: glycosyltransferase family 4 protein, partial [Nitrososphaera sp.]